MAAVDPAEIDFPSENEVVFPIMLCFHRCSAWGNVQGAMTDRPRREDHENARAQVAVSECSSGGRPDRQANP
jgi:hypothetical protein